MHLLRRERSTVLDWVQQRVDSVKQYVPATDAAAPVQEDFLSYALSDTLSDYDTEDAVFDYSGFSAEELASLTEATVTANSGELPDDSYDAVVTYALPESEQYAPVPDRIELGKLLEPEGDLIIADSHFSDYSLSDYLNETVGDEAHIGFFTRALKDGPVTVLNDHTVVMPDTKAVGVYLEDAGGKIWQKDLVDSSLWSRSKVSRIVTEMAEEDAIEKVRLGRENLITYPGNLL